MTPSSSRSRDRASPNGGKSWWLLAFSLAANAVFLVAFFLHFSWGKPPAHVSGLAPASLLRRPSTVAQRVKIPVEKTSWKEITFKTRTPALDASETGHEPTAPLAPESGVNDNLTDDDEPAAYPRPQLENLPREKREQLQRIASDYGELSGEIYAQSSGLILPEDREKLAFLEREKTADLEKVLTPPELEEYQTRSNDTERLHRR